MKTLEDNRDALVRLAEALLEYETLDSCEIEAIIKGEPLKRRVTAPSDTDPEGQPTLEKTPSHPTLPQLINPEGKPAPA
jgi:hypothetical protein